MLEIVKKLANLFTRGGSSEDHSSGVPSSRTLDNEDSDDDDSDGRPVTEHYIHPPKRWR